ncbi:DNA methyltransferase [Shimia sp. R9_3]|uniref:DNA methyltransferase n=1 Tax=Shimia sp. R9_3 TaxID=2821113 RepID=UPI001ADB8676|nr:DNA methyltransferase [Shimia sp. R9_3]MBO9401433.1 DNA methylase [Shimia sp. R9_3]
MSFQNEIICGESVKTLKTISEGSIDLIVTDPPYGVNYRDRTGRKVKNDDDLRFVLPVFEQAFRALKQDSYCISFYGWNKADLFLKAWKDAGFRVVGHLVWTKNYASRTGVVKYHHEQAYVLAKGRPSRPKNPIADVLPWTATGNRAHPTEKAVQSLTPLIWSFSKPGELVCDPFAGSGSTCVAAALAGRNYLGIELEDKYCTHARKRLSGVERYMATKERKQAA